jgi:hypothetical protein
MKWLKVYSLILVVISLSLFITSFFIIDFFPVWYKFYMGHEILSSKMDKLYLFASNTIDQLRVYSILLLISSSVMYFTKRIKYYLYIL